MRVVRPHEFICGLFLTSVVAATSASAAEAVPAKAGDVAARRLPWDVATALPDEIAQALEDRRYADAVAALDRLIAAGGENQARWSYAKGRALHLAGKFDEAVAALTAAEAVRPESVWTLRARFARGASLAAKGDFASAESVYRAEAERLLSSERKQSLADIYLEFARKYATPRDEKSPPDQPEPDYAKAGEFFQSALDLGPKPELRAEIELAMAECRRRAGNFDEAAQRFEHFVKTYPDDRRTTEARYRWGECRLREGRAVDARRTWQDLLALWPGDRRPADADQAAFLPQAAFEIAATYGLPQPPDDDALALGTAALEAFLARFPEHRLVGRAQVLIVESGSRRNRFAEAATAARRFLAVSQKPEVDEAAELRNLLGSALQRQKQFAAALVAWREFLTLHPTHPAWSEVQQRVVETEYLVGADAFERKDYAAARRAWTEFLTRYPLDSRAPFIGLQFGEAEFRAEHWDAAIAEWRRLVSKYPDHEAASQAQFRIGLVLEEKLARPIDAMNEYRKIKSGSQVGAARTRIAQLTAKRLDVATERIFRTDETPRIRVRSRNVERLKVRVYRVDLETYFRKMHLARGVESLDLALIDPDRSFEFAVPDYAEFKPCEFDLPIEVAADGDAAASRPAVLAVTISSRTLEATTLVLRSDLEVVVKSSRNELFVYAQNMRTGKPWPGARILASNGSEIFAEGDTSAEGVFRGKEKKLREAADVRVFALSAGHTASNVVGLGDVGLGTGLEARGYLYTDRAAYPPGETVHVRGVVRGVADDRFTTLPGRKYRVEVWDERTRVIFKTEATSGSFGSFHTYFTLPDVAQPGVYRLQACDDDERCFLGTFRVENYSLEPVRFAIDAPRKVVFRGEEIEGTLSAKYYYGTPLAGREVRYSLDGGPVVSTTTDAQGEIRFKFPTREFRESQTITLVAELPERNLHATTDFLVAVQAFSLSVSTLRDVVTADESFEATVEARTADGRPTSEAVRLHVIERIVVDGRAGEREVSQHDLKTDAATGRARITLTLAQGAKYVLRATSRDRFDNPVSGSREVFVSDASDAVRLRLLADRQTFKLGETARLRVVWREAQATALVTYQGAEILGYRLIELAPGDNPLDVPLEARLAPNFQLEVNVMFDPRGPEPKDRVRHRFHAARVPIVVERELAVSVEVKRRGAAGGAPRPGETIELHVRTLDPQGKPAAAELSLALIDRAGWDRFGSAVGPIHEFFRGTTREPAIRTVASIDFAYRPPTHPINPRLLTEQERLEIAAEEDESRRLLVENEAAGRSFGVDRMSRSDLRREAATSESTPQTEGQGMLGSLALQQAAKPQSMAAPRGAAAAMSADKQGAGTLRDADVRKSLRSSDEKRRSAGADGKAEEFALLRDGAERLSLGDRFDVAQVFNARGEYVGRREYVLIADGVQSNLNGETLADPALRAERTQALARSTVLPQSGPQETAYWNPAVTTDAEGRATVEVTLPERSTAWKLSAKGITADTLAGEAAADLVVREELFGEIAGPSVMTEGDRADAGVVVHDVRERAAGEAPAPIDVVFRVTIGGRTVEEQRTLPASTETLRELTFPLAATPADAVRADSAELTLIVRSGDRQDVVRRTIPIRPYGYEVTASAGGTAQSDATTWIEPPSGLTLERPRLEIVVGASIERSLLDVVLGTRIVPACDVGRAFASPLETAVGDLQAALALQKLLASTRSEPAPEAAELTARIRSTIGYLVGAQADDGGWTWTGSHGTSDRGASVRVVWALAEARAAAHAVPPDAFDRAVQYLAARQTEAADDDLDLKAALLHALAEAGRGDFAVANRLYRSRAALTPAGGAALALALVKMDHRPMAVDLLSGILARPAAVEVEIAGGVRQALRRRHVVEEQALLALAVQRAQMNAPQLAELVEHVTAARRGNRWSPERATGPATAALAAWGATHRPGGERYRLAVVVNEYEAATLDVDPQAPPRSIVVDGRHLVAGKQRVQFRMTGRGHLAYQCLLSGFVPEERLKSTTQAWEVRRTYEPAPREFDGRELPRGFAAVAGSYTPFRNPLTQLPIGRRGLVELRVWRHDAAQWPDDRLEYLVVREPLPAGTQVVESSVRGGFERFDLLPGEIVFYVGNRRHPDGIRYDVVGGTAGTFRAGRTVVVDVHRPERFAVEEPAALTVLARGRASVDAYRFTPDELLELGRRHAARREWKSVIAALGELPTAWTLKADALREALRMLLDAHLEVGPAADVVKYFESVKEKSPDVEIPFESILKVGAAYHELGEYERSYLVFRATIESSFGRDGAVAGFLDEQGEFLRSVDVMRRLIDEYPPEPYAAAARYALAQQVYAYAARASSDEKLRAQKLTRLTLVAGAARMLEAFLTDHPDDPAADQAAFAAANARLELEQYDAAVARCEASARRYPNSEFLDSYWYVVGYCRFAAGKHEQALEMCRKVADMKRVDPATGRETASTNRERAIYILGQIYHSLGKAADAVREYARVAQQIPDARRAIEYFDRRAIGLPEVTTIRPGLPVEIALKFRNVPRCDLKVYRIDLMKFSLLRRNLEAITQINLAGIKPLAESTVELGDGKDYRDRERKIPLPLRDVGAYLVVCRGDNLHGSGFVLITPLQIEVQEEAASGEVRATLKDVVAERFIAGAHVKIIGARDDDFKAGETDLRGVFAAEPISGRSTVIAQVDDQQYAFFRGDADLLPAADAAPRQAVQLNAPQAGGRTEAAKQSTLGKEYLLQEVLRSNGTLQLQQQDNLRNNYFKKDNRGVKAKDAF